MYLHAEKSRVDFLFCNGTIGTMSGGDFMAKGNADLDAILKKLEAAEKEFEEKLSRSRLDELIGKEEARRQRKH